MLTFDDAYIDVYDVVFPLCQRKSVPFIAFVSVNNLGKDNTWNYRAQFKARHINIRQLKEMAKYGVDIGSHALSHRNFLKLTDHELVEELSLSKETIEDLIGRSVLSFAYPYGDIRLDMLGLVSKYYKIAFSMEVFNGLEDNIFCVPRIDGAYIDMSRIFRKDLLYSFMNKLFGKS